VRQYHRLAIVTEAAPVHRRIGRVQRQAGEGRGGGWRAALRICYETTL